MNRNRTHKRQRSIAVMSNDCTHGDHSRCYGSLKSSGMHFHCGCGCHTTRQLSLTV